MTLDDYNLDSDNDFCETITSKATSGESSKFTARKESKGFSTSTAGTAKSSPVSEASLIAATKRNIEVADKRVIVLKTTVKNIWKPEYIKPLHDLVDINNTIVTHTFAFIKYIFVSELEKNIEFDLKSYVHKSFFVEVFLSLTLRQERGDIKETTKLYRQLIAKHKGSYCENASYIPVKLANAQQNALYECTKIETAYYNNIKAHFGDRLREMLNRLCKKKGKSSALRERMVLEGCSTKVIQAAVRRDIFTPCSQVKLAVAKKKMPNSEILDKKSLSELETFLLCILKSTHSIKIRFFMM